MIWLLSGSRPHQVIQAGYFVNPATSFDLVTTSASLL